MIIGDEQWQQQHPDPTRWASLIRSEARKWSRDPRLGQEIFGGTDTVWRLCNRDRPAELSDVLTSYLEVLKAVKVLKDQDRDGWEAVMDVDLLNLSFDTRTQIRVKEVAQRSGVHRDTIYERRAKFWELVAAWVCNPVYVFDDAAVPPDKFIQEVEA